MQIVPVRVPLLEVGLVFSLLGSALGLFIFLTLLGSVSGKPFLVFDDYGPKEWIAAFGLAMLYGGPPAFVTGMAAAALRRHLSSCVLFVLAMAPVGALATAIYLALFEALDGFEGISPFIIATGALAAVLCAAPFCFWTKPAPQPLQRR